MGTVAPRGPPAGLLPLSRLNRRGAITREHMAAPSCRPGEPRQFL